MPAARNDEQTNRRGRMRRWRRVAACALLGWVVLAAGVAVLAQVPMPLVELEIPERVLIGETFEFTVRFRNAAPGTVGEGPFVDLFAEYRGKDCTTPSPSSPNAAGACDGIEILSARVELASPSSYPISATNSPQPALTPLGSLVPIPCPFACNATTTYFTHPFGASPALPQGAQGFQAVVFELPFSVYPGGAIDALITVTARVHEYADVGEDLCIYARGGFKNGTWGANVQQEFVSACVSTAVFTVSKHHTAADCQCSCTHCADEMVTGPNHVHTYRIDVDVAGGQTIEDLVLLDTLPAAVQFRGANPPILTVQGSPESSSTYPDPSIPGGELILNWDSITGASGSTPDVSVEYEFTIPEIDAYGDPIVWDGCLPTGIVNVLQAKARWTPSDERDDPEVVTAEADHEIELKCLALQKQVALFSDTNHPAITPGDTLEYTLAFQISDYTTFGGIVVEDYLSDGQTYVAGATLHVEDPILGAWDIPLDGYLELDSGPFLHGCPVSGGTCGAPPTAPIAGGTRLVFDVGEAMLNTIGTDELSGVPGASVPAAGTICYRVSVDDVFQDYAWLKANGAFAPLSDPEVDKLDPLLNCARIRAEQRAPTDAIVEDGTYTCARVVGDTLVKSIYRIYRPSTGEAFGPYPYDSWDCPDDVFPGDWVTYRIHKVIPSSDAEYLTVEDWLPEGVFGAVGAYGWAYDSSGPSAAGPVSGMWKLGPTHDAPGPAGGYAGIVAVDAAENALTFDYGTIVDGGSNEPCMIDILFTVAVSGAALPDKTAVVNIAQECESNTYASGCSSGACPGTGTTFCQMAIARFTLREPELRISKAAVAAIPTAAQPIPGYGTLSQPTPVEFHAPCDPAVPAFDSANGQYVASTFQSDLSDVDHEDIVRYAIVVENTGGAPALDVTVEDVLPSCLEAPGCYGADNPYGVVVTDGTGAAIQYAGDLFTGGIELADPGPTSIDAGAIDGSSAAPGRNVAVITFDAKLNHPVECCVNEAELVGYASVEAGNDFVSAGLGGPFTDEAAACGAPTVDKCIVCTSESRTMPQSTDAPESSVPAVKGEIVRYRLVIGLPEGSYSYLAVNDWLHQGMELLTDTVEYAFVYDSDLTADVAVNAAGATLPSSCSAASSISDYQTLLNVGYGNGTGLATFTFGAVHNLDDDADAEYLIVEFNAIVRNVASNVAATATSAGSKLHNYCTITASGVASTVQSDTVYVEVVGPRLELEKEIVFVDTDGDGCPSDDDVEIRISVTNVGTAVAYDIGIDGASDCGSPGHSWPGPVSQDHHLVPGATYTWTEPWTIHMNRNCCGCTTTIEAVYSTLPGDYGDDPNCTGSIPPQGPGEELGEWVSTQEDPSAWTWEFELCGTICGTKWNEQHSCDGKPGTGDDIVAAGWTIVATETSTGYQCRAVTDGQGEYCLCVPEGTYEVTEEIQPGWCMSYPSSPWVVSVVAGQTVTGVDVANCECCEPAAELALMWIDADDVAQKADVVIGCNDPDVTLPGSVVPGPTLEIGIWANVQCDTACPGCGCAPSYAWSVSRDDGSGFNPFHASQDPLPAAFTLPDDAPAEYRIDLSVYCDDVLCCARVLRFRVAAPCDCGQWLSVELDSQAYTGPVQPGQVVEIDDDCPISVTADYFCTMNGAPGCPIDRIEFDLSHPQNPAGPQVFYGVSPATMTYHVPKIPTGFGVIYAAITPYCGGHPCSAFHFTLHFPATSKGGKKDDEGSCGENEWPDFDGDGVGEIRVEGRVVDCGGYVGLEPEEIDGPVTIRPTFNCAGDAGPCSYAWTVRGPDGYATGSSDEAVRGPIEFVPPAAGTYVAAITPVCAEQSCNACQISIGVGERGAADLAIERVVSIPDSPRVGESFGMEVTVVNLGSADSGRFAVELSGRSRAESKIVPALAAGASTTVVFLDWTCSADTADWTATADAKSEIEESDEANNSRSGSVACHGAPPLPMRYRWEFATFEAGGAVAATRTMPDELRAELLQLRVTRAALDSSTLPVSAQFRLDLAALAGTVGGVLPGDPATYTVEYALHGSAAEYLGVLSIEIGVEESGGEACTCSRWGEIDVNGQIVPCGGRASVASGEVVEIEPDYRCSGSDCGTRFVWEVDGPEGFYLIEGSEEIRFLPPFPGTYEIALTPECGGGQCPACSFVLVVER